MNTLKIIRYSVWAAVALIAALAGAALLLPPKSGGDAGGGAVGGPFVLASHDGASVDSKTLLGRPYAVFFGFTNCPDVCPTTMFEIGEDMKALGAAAQNFRVFFITVDPERDTPELLKSYLSAFDARISGLIVKNEAELQSITKAFKAHYRKVPTSSGYTMDHTAAVYLFDRRGLFWGTLDHQETSETRRAKLKRLLAG